MTAGTRDASSSEQRHEVRGDENAKSDRHRDVAGGGVTSAVHGWAAVTTTTSSSITTIRCPAAASFDSIGCQLEELATLLGNTPGGGPTRAVMLRQVDRARSNVALASIHSG